jgi:hypothetical protein
MEADGLRFIGLYLSREASRTISHPKASRLPPRGASRTLVHEGEGEAGLGGACDDQEEEADLDKEG